MAHPELEKFRAEWNALPSKGLAFPEPEIHPKHTDYIWSGKNKSYEEYVLSPDSRNTAFVIFAHKWVVKLAVMLNDTLKENEELAKKSASLNNEYVRWHNKADEALKEVVRLREFISRVQKIDPNDLFALGQLQEEAGRM